MTLTSNNVASPSGDDSNGNDDDDTRDKTKGVQYTRLVDRQQRRLNEGRPRTNANTPNPIMASAHKLVM